MRSVLIADVGLLDVFAEARRRGFLPADMQAKISVMLPVSNPATARALVALGADTLNLTTDLSLAQIAAIRAVVDVPLDIYVEVPDNVGGFVRLHEIPEIVRVAAPVYLKFGLRNAPDVYPAGTHLEATTVALTRERVRRARLGLELLEREWPGCETSELGARGLALVQAGGVSADVVTLGEALVALVADEGRPLSAPGTFTPFVAGAEANVAMGLARLGRPVAFIGRVGADGLGQMVRNGLRAEGVDVRWLSDDPEAPTGALARDRRSFPPPEVVYLRRGSAASRLAPADVNAAGDVIAAARWLHLTGITPALSPSCRAAVQQRAPVRARGRRARLARRQPAPAAVERAGGRAGAARAGRALRPRDRRARTRRCCCAARPRPPRWPSASGSRPSSSSARAAPSAAATASWPRTRASRWRRWMSSAPATRSRPATSTRCSTAPSLAESLRRANACGAVAVSAVGDATGLPTRAELERVLAGGGDVVR